MVQLQPRGDRRHGAAAFAGGFVELLGCVDALAAGLDLAEEGVGLMLQDVGLGNCREQGLLFPGLTGFLGGDSLEPVAQLLALVQQGAGLQLLAEIGGQAPVDPQGLLRAGFAPAAVALRLDLPAELLPCHGGEPLAPELPKLLPLGWAEPAHLELPPARRQQLTQQGRAHSLVGVPQGLLQRQGHQAQPSLPALEALLEPRWLAGQGRRGLVGIARADWPQARLLWFHLAGQSHHLALAIQQQQVAVAPHQFHHQPAQHGLARAPGEAKLHHPLPALLENFHQGQPPQPMLQLLGQGAAIALAGRRRDRVQTGRFRLPAELEPVGPAEAAQAELQGVGAGLLGLLEAAGQQQGPPFSQQRPQGRHVHCLQARGGHGQGRGFEAGFYSAGQS